MDNEALLKAFQAQSELIDTLVSVVQRHEAEIKAIHNFIEGQETVYAEEAKLEASRNEMNANLVAWINATEAKLDVIAERLHLK